MASSLPFKSFKVRALLDNLTAGKGSNVKLAHVSRVFLTLGPKDTCTLRPMMSLFSVNELARLHHCNPQIDIQMKEGKDSELKVETSNCTY